jgi:hypothetical protein
MFHDAPILCVSGGYMVSSGRRHTAAHEYLTCLALIDARRVA